MQPLFEIRPSPGKGQGVFATTTIPSGTTIMQDRKIMRIAQSRSTVFSHATDNDVAHAFARLSKHDQERYLAMSPGSTISTQHIENNKQTLLNIYRANAFGEEGEKYMFFDICRINHSCAPNAELLLNEDQVQGAYNDGKDSIMALRTIEKGEEVLICYNTLFFSMTREQRKAYAKKVWGFECGCAACGGLGRDAAGAAPGVETGGRCSEPSMSDARRALINILISRLKARPPPDWSSLLGLSPSLPRASAASATVLAQLPLDSEQQTGALNVLLATLLLTENISGILVLDAYTTATMTLMKQIDTSPLEDGDVALRQACSIAKKWMQLSMNHRAHVRGALSQETLGWRNAWDVRVQRSPRLKAGFATKAPAAK